jgi:hypothetical protein
VNIETINAELRLVAALRRAASSGVGPLPSMAVADALLDERRELTGCASCSGNLLNLDVNKRRSAYAPTDERVVIRYKHSPKWGFGRETNDFDQRDREAR